MTPKMTVITATARPDGLPMVDACLERQTFKDFEWLIVAPDKAASRMNVVRPNTKVICDPPRNDGDFYCLNKAWNEAIRQSQADLIVFAVDWIWFDKDALRGFAEHYDADPLVGVTSVGHHYHRIVDGRPELRWKDDDRLQMVEKYTHRYNGFPPIWMEMAFSSLPKSKIDEVGGFDPKYDAVAGLSEKELCCRMYEADVRFVMDADIEIRCFTHERRNYTQNWDEAYAKAEQMFAKDLAAIEAGERRKI